MAFTPNEITKRFVEAVKYMVTHGLVKNYKEIVDRLEWSQSSMYAVMNNKRNVPHEIGIKFFELSDHLIKKVIRREDRPDTEMKFQAPGVLMEGRWEDFVSDHEGRLLALEASIKTVRTALAELRHLVTKEPLAKILAELDNTSNEIIAILYNEYIKGHPLSKAITITPQQGAGIQNVIEIKDTKESDTESDTVDKIKKQK